MTADQALQIEYNRIDRDDLYIRVQSDGMWGLQGEREYQKMLFPPEEMPREVAETIMLLRASHRNKADDNHFVDYYVIEGVGYAGTQEIDPFGKGDREKCFVRMNMAYLQSIGYDPERKKHDKK